MTSWLLLAVAAQFISAVSVLIDRHIVVKAQHIGKPIVYAFYVSLLSGFVVVLIPFGVEWPTIRIFTLALLSATAFVAAIFCLYSALRLARASDVAPVVGAVSAIATLFLARMLIDGDVTEHILLPIFLLAAGTALISHFHFSRHAIVFTLLSGAAFGTTALLAKLVFLETTFLDGFFWTRIMSAALACTLLAVPLFRREIFSGGARSSHGAKALVIGNKILGGVAGVLTAFAISLGSVSVVNALSGLQFAFLFVFALLFARYMPSLKDGSARHGGWQTGVGVAVICSGLAALYLGAAV